MIFSSLDLKSVIGIVAAKPESKYNQIRVCFLIWIKIHLFYLRLDSMWIWNRIKIGFETNFKSESLSDLNSSLVSNNYLALHLGFILDTAVSYSKNIVSTLAPPN